MNAETKKVVSKKAESKKVLAQQAESVETRVNRRRFLTAVVTSDKMDKTRVVQVQKVIKHSKYEKQVRNFVKYKAHDEKNAAKTGDVVRIMETRPLSKDKRWIISEIVGSKV